MCPYHKVCTSKGDGCENCDFAIALWKERKKVISLKNKISKLTKEYNDLVDLYSKLLDKKHELEYFFLSLENLIDDYKGISFEDLCQFPNFKEKDNA